MAVLVQSLFFLISLAQFTNMFFVFLDMKAHEKRRSRANGVVIGISSVLFLASPALIFSFGYLHHQMEKQRGFFLNVKNHYKKIVLNVSILIAILLICMLVHLVIDGRRFAYIGLFLLLDVAACILFIWAVWKEKKKISKNQSITGDPESQTANRSDDHLEQEIMLLAIAQQENEANEEQDLSFLKWYDYIVSEVRMNSLQMCQFFYMQKWMQELKAGRDAGIDCPLLRRLNNEMSQQCAELKLSHLKRDRLRTLASRYAHTNNEANVLLLQRSLVAPPYQSRSRINDAPPPYTSRQISVVDDHVDVNM